MDTAGKSAADEGAAGRSAGGRSYAGKSAGPGVREVRLAVTMVGGVSLAIWMSGVAREITHLVQASRQPNAIDPARDGDQAEAIRVCYRDLLELLRVNVSVDVLTGTSAAGSTPPVLASPRDSSRRWAACATSG